MSTFRNPLRRWRKEYECDAPLVEAQCHARVETRMDGRLSRDLHQCRNEIKTGRPYINGEIPVCGFHARQYDDALRRHEEREARNAQRDTLSDRCQVLRERLPSACASGTNQVLVNIDELERLMRVVDAIGSPDPSCSVAAVVNVSLEPSTTRSVK